MKKILFFLAIVAAITFTSCTELAAKDDNIETYAIEKDDIEVDGDPDEEDPDTTGV